MSQGAKMSTGETVNENTAHGKIASNARVSPCVRATNYKCLAIRARNDTPRVEITRDLFPTLDLAALHPSPFPLTTAAADVATFRTAQFTEIMQFSCCPLIYGAFRRRAGFDLGPGCSRGIHAVCFLFIFLGKEGNS